jgi:hypothetical protein
MPTEARTEAEQNEWDALFRALVLDCVRREGFEKAPGCLHLARDVADAAIEERRKSQEQRQ